MMFGAQPGWISRNARSSTIRSMTPCMSYGFDASSGTMESSAASIRSVGSDVSTARRISEVVLRQESEEAPRRGKSLSLVVGGEMRHAAPGRVRRRAAERLGVDILVGDSLHDIGPGDEHVARPIDHDREVGDGRRVHRATGARPQDQGQLGHDPGRQGIAQEDVGVAAERDDTLLDPCPAGIVQADDRSAHLHRKVHDLADLLGIGLGQGSTEDGEVLAEDEHQPTVDRAVAGDDAVAEERRFDLGVAIRDERIELDERICVEQQVESLARGQFSAFVLLIDTVLAAPESRLLAHRFKTRQSLFIRRHQSDLRENGVSLCTDRGHHTVTVIHGNGEQLAPRVDNRVPAITTGWSSMTGRPARPRQPRAIDSEVMPQ